jgi:hypothetical protein
LIAAARPAAGIMRANYCAESLVCASANVTVPASAGTAAPLGLKALMPPVKVEPFKQLTRS